MIHTGTLPLAGIKVVELGTHVAVPYATRMMADCGAEVIKVENITGDEWRVFAGTYLLPITVEENAVFSCQNSNKEFCSINLKTEEGKAFLLRLLESADVFVSSVRGKALKKMGLDYESIKDRFPKLIYAHFTGFGNAGPEASRPGFDLTAFWARSGAMIDWANKGDFPVRPISGMGDTVTSSLLLCGILTALIGRQKTGRGTLLDMSLYGSTLWHHAVSIIMAQDCYGNKYPKDKMSPGNPLAHLYRCKDGQWLMMAVVGFDKNWVRMTKVLGIEHLADDPRFNCIDNASKNINELITILNDVFMQKTRDEWAVILDANNVPYERLIQTREIPYDEQAWANDYLEDVEFLSGNHVAIPKLPFHFSEYSVKNFTQATSIGVDTEAIMSRHGYSAEEIAALKEQGVVR